MKNNILSSQKWVDENHHITVTKKIRRSTSSLHMHSFFEIELVTEGFGIQNLNGNLYEIKKGSAYFLSPIDFHEVTPKSTMELINISFDSCLVSPEILKTIIYQKNNMITNLSMEDTDTVLMLTNILKNNFAITDTYSDINKQNLLESIMIILLRRMENTNNISLQVELQPIYQCLQYLFLHFMESPSLDMMAKISGYSIPYFSKKFHDITGKKYIDFLVSIKLNHAKMLLSSTQLSITEITSACGFNSISNFNRVFKNTIGISPSQYRNEKSTKIK